MQVDSDSEAEDFMTELDHYLKSARVKDVEDPRKWWFENRGSYPCLSRMARDFLTIPGKFFLYLFAGLTIYIYLKHLL